MTSHGPNEPFEEEVRASFRRRLGELEPLIPSAAPARANVDRGRVVSVASPNRGPMARSIRPAAVLVVVVVAVSAAALLGPAMLRGQTPAASPSPSASVAPTASSSTTPGVTALAKGHLLGAMWSPDGGYVAVTVESANATVAPIQQIFDKHGTKVVSIAADAFAWTGPTTYVLGRKDASQTMSEFAGQVGSSKETAVSTGSVKAPSSDPLACVPWAVSILGTPLMCSADGSQVAVLEITAEDLPFTGWLEIVEAKTGKVTRELRDAQAYTGSWAAFSPDGGSLAYTDASTSAYIANLSTGAIHEVYAAAPLAWWVTPAWLPDGRLAVPDSGAGKVRAFSADGIESSANLPYGRILAVSSAGVVLAFDDLTPKVVVQASDGTRSTLDLGASPNGASSAYWSPDGREAVMVCTDLTPTGPVYDETAVLIVSH